AEADSGPTCSATSTGWLGGGRSGKGAARLGAASSAGAGSGLRSEGSGSGCGGSGARESSSTGTWATAEGGGGGGPGIVSGGSGSPAAALAIVTGASSFGLESRCRGRKVRPRPVRRLRAEPVPEAGGFSGAELMRRDRCEWVSGYGWIRAGWRPCTEWWLLADAAVAGTDEADQVLQFGQRRQF